MSSASGTDVHQYVENIFTRAFDTQKDIQFNSIHFYSFISFHFLEIISLCWIFGIVIGFLPLFGWHKEVTEGCLFVEIMDYNYLVFLYFTTIITPALILAIFYGLIYKVILKQVNNTIHGIKER